MIEQQPDQVVTYLSKEGDLSATFYLQDEDAYIGISNSFLQDLPEFAVVNPGISCVVTDRDIPKDELDGIRHRPARVIPRSEYGSDTERLVPIYLEFNTRFMGRSFTTSTGITGRTTEEQKEAFMNVVNSVVHSLDLVHLME